MPDRSLFRILDANANRAAEAIRVVEEAVRLAENHAALTERCKRTRHRLSGLIATMRSRFPLDLARDTPADVGTRITLPSETRRDSIEEILRANFSRLKESLRCLEEYSKPLAPDWEDGFAGFERLRYDVYLLEQQALVPWQRRQRLASARLYAIVDGSENESEFVALVEPLSELADIIQLRDKRLGDRQLLARAEILVRCCGTHCLSIVNDRTDIAVAAGADGVHVGQDDLPVEQLRQILGAELIVGVSTHGLDQARSAERQGADYLGAGPVFHSTTKDFAQLVGLEYVRQVVQETPLPVFAIGGITNLNLEEVLATGAERVAVGGYLTGADDPIQAARLMARRLASVS